MVSQSATKPLTIAINCQILPGSGHGGIEMLIRALLTALGQLEDGDENYVIITHPDAPHWLQEHIQENMYLVTAPKKRQRFTGRTPALTRPALWRLRQMLIDIIGGENFATYPHVPVSNGFYESLGADVIHFPYQSFVICGIPTLYNPHDLQHKHYPDFFTAKALRAREVLYHEACQYAQKITVASEWLKNDLVQQYALAAEKIQVVPLAPFLSAYDDNDMMSTDIRKTYDLPADYMLYPAVTWAHKNHLRLLSAMAQLRDEHGVRVHLVATGALNDHYHERIVPHIADLALQDQVSFLGHIPAPDLRNLYQQAQFVVHPSLFEASSSMLWEAAQNGVPALASDIPPIREQAGSEAVLFNPLDVDEMAALLRRMVTDAAWRQAIADYGVQRLQVFSWERTARAYRALYRQLGRVSLTAEDEQLLASNWMQDTV